MRINSFDELARRVQQMAHKSRVAVVAAAEEHTLASVCNAAEEGLVEPILIGDATEIAALLHKLGRSPDIGRIVDAPTLEDCLAVAMHLIRAGEADLLMKGMLETSALMRTVLNKESGLSLGRRLSLVGVYQCPAYGKLFAISDVGMMTYPDLAGKKDILLGAVGVMQSLGVDTPKVAVLSAVEAVNPKMPDTVDGDALKQMNRSGEITGCIVEGPISFDLATRGDAAAVKGYDSPVAGDADVLIVPNIVCGNVLAKCITGFAGGQTAGVVVGAAVPVILSSRSAPVADKYYSIALAAWAAGRQS